VYSCPRKQAWTRERYVGTTIDSWQGGLAGRLQLQSKHDSLERQLRRKDKALAEAAALLVLQKKFQALWADEV